MKYRIVKRKAVHKWGQNSGYCSRECWDVQKRFMFFFWVGVERFENDWLAKSYLKALKECDEN